MMDTQGQNDSETPKWQQAWTCSRGLNSPLRLTSKCRPGNSKTGLEYGYRLASWTLTLRPWGWNVAI